MNQRTQDEINRQIEGLKKEKEGISLRTMFGASSHEKIDAQIAVLEGRSEPDDFYIDESSEEYSDGDNDVYFAAEEAENWLRGHSKEDLFSE
jgi:hypothetical protein